MGALSLSRYLESERVNMFTPFYDVWRVAEFQTPVGYRFRMGYNNFVRNDLYDKQNGKLKNIYYD